VETDRAACEGFFDDLPATLNDEEPRDTEPADALGAAYGDPAMVLTCGVALPDDYDKFSSCEEANGVGWYVPLEEIEDQAADVTLTAVGYQPVVRLEMPADYRPEGAAAAIAELATPVKDNLRLVEGCD